MTVIGVPIKLPSAKGMLVVGGVFLMCILINVGLHVMAGTQVTKETFINFARDTPSKWHIWWERDSACR